MPTKGERCASSWIVRIRVMPTVVKPNEKSDAMLSGGSSVSWSVTWLAKTVAVQAWPPAKSASGSSVKVVGPPLATAVWAPLELHAIENQLPVTSTGSLKVIVTFEPSGTLKAPSVGFVEETVGAGSPHELNG